MSSKYKNWIVAKQAEVAKGDVADYMAWYLENPSPMGGVFGRELTRPEVIRLAVASVALSFQGTDVEVRVSETPEDSAKVVNVVVGRIAGTAYVCTGGTSNDALVLNAEHGVNIVIPIRNVLDMENHDPREASSGHPSARIAR